MAVEQLDDPARAERVRIIASGLGAALADQNYEQRARAVLAIAEALNVNARIFSSLAPECDSKECTGSAALRVYWPGQTRELCRACTDRATRVAEAMGFSLQIGRIT